MAEEKKSGLYPVLSGLTLLLTGKLGEEVGPECLGPFWLCGQLIWLRIKCQSPPKKILDHERRECKLSALDNTGIKS